VGDGEKSRLSADVCGLTNPIVSEAEITFCTGGWPTAGEDQHQAPGGQDLPCQQAHGAEVWCPTSGTLSPCMALKILKADQEHSLDEHCLVGAALNMLSETNISVNRDEIITSLASRIGRDTKKELDGMTSSRGKMEGEDLTPAQTNTMKEIFSSFLEPWSDPSSRCASCLRCSSCAPIQLLSQQQKIEKLKGRENWELKQNISIAQDPGDPEKLRVVCNLPVDMSKIEEKLSSNNVGSTITEYDRKMVGLTTTDKMQLETEFQKWLTTNIIRKSQVIVQKSRKKYGRRPY
jgi:hypothetical protein